MKVFLLPEALGNSILQYLVKQPYGEVAGLVGGLAQLQEATEAPPKPPVPLKVADGEKK